MSLKDLERYHFDRLAKRAGVAKLPSSPFTLSQVLKVMLAPHVAVELATQGALLASMDAWSRAGAQVYELGAPLLSCFEQTDTGSLTGAQLKLSGPLYLHLEGCPLLITRERDDVQVPLTGLYVVESGDYWIITLIGLAQPKDVAISFLWPHAEWLKGEQPFERFLEGSLAQDLKPEHAQAYRGALRIIAHTSLYLVSAEAKLERVEDQALERLHKDLHRLNGRRAAAALKALEQYSAAKVTRIFPGLSALTRAPQDGASARGRWSFEGEDQEHTSSAPRWIMPH